MARMASRTQSCGRADASTRLAHARKFLEVAEITASEHEIPESASVAAALAVLASIAASDAACCAALGRRARGQDHHDAEELLAQVLAGGADAASTLRRLLDLKDTAQYGLIHVSRQRLRSALRQASKLVLFVSEILGFLQQPKEIQEWIGQGKLGLRHVRPLNQIANPAERIELAKQAVDRDWSAATRTRRAVFNFLHKESRATTTPADGESESISTESSAASGAAGPAPVTKAISEGQGFASRVTETPSPFSSTAAATPARNAAIGGQAVRPLRKFLSLLVLGLSSIPVLQSFTRAGLAYW